MLTFANIRIACDKCQADDVHVDLLNIAVIKVHTVYFCKTLRLVIKALINVLSHQPHQGQRLSQSELAPLVRT